MKYSKIIGLQEYFHPVFNIENETVNYWKQFIPNDQFYDVLRKTLTAIETSDPSLRKSIWIQGTFGTGKSHAASVIKHLLFDKLPEVLDYINESIEETSLKSKLNNYRKKHKLLPVVLKGIPGSISNIRSFALQIEKAVKKSPWFNDLNIVTPSDFERLIEKVRSPLFDWDSFIKKHDELNIYVSNKDEILKKLNVYDIDFFQILEDTLITKEGWSFAHTEITEWLTEINNEVISQKKADGIIIFWDEFTSVMDSINSGIINQIQNIAELSEKNNIFMYLISHRTPHQYSIPKEDLTRMNDRFHIIQYRMEPITTYHIIAATIKKINIREWKRLQGEIFGNSTQWDDLINLLTNNHSASAKSKIKDLFPIHPYSAYLSTFIARNLGSTNRSIFGFLYDKELGFLNYLNKELNGERLLTPDYLWDYFINAFENDQEARFNQVLDKYRLNIQRVKDHGENCTKVFKGILLLNILFKVIEVAEEEGSPVTPSAVNITSLFIGSGFEEEIANILTFIDEKGIVTKTPGGDFLIEFSSLPIREIEQEREGVRNQFKDVINVLKYAQVDKDLEKTIFKDNIYRDSEIALFSTNIENEHILRNRLIKVFSKPYSLKCAVFFANGEYEHLSSIPKIKDLAKDDDFQNIIFVIVEEPFSERNYEKFVDYIARKQVSDNHSYDEQSANYENYAKEQVKEWFTRIRNRYMQIIFRDNDEKHLSTQIGSVINRSYSPIIFSKGIDNVSDLYRNANVWKFQNAIKAAEIFIFADDRSELEEKTSGGPNVYLKYLVKDKDGEYIVSDNMMLKPDYDPNHTLNIVQSEIDTKFTKLKQRSLFNIGEELMFLTEAPFGLYTNMPNMALMGFVLRKYVGELYVADVGRPIEKDEMRDLIGYLFSFWQDKRNQNKLNVRFGSKEERELKKALCEIFQISDPNSITDARWAILNYVKDQGKYPLWTLKYIDETLNYKHVIEELNKLTVSFTNELDIKLIKSLLDVLKDYKYDLKLINKPENYKRGFLKFLQTVDDKIHIDETVFDEIEKFILENLQEEKGRWKEEEVREKVLKWYIHKTQVPPPNPTPPGSPEAPQKPDTPGFIPTPEREKIISKVKNFNLGEQEIKNRIVKMIDENQQFSQLISLIDKYFS
jgi:hypothetical protein